MEPFRANHLQRSAMRKPGPDLSPGVLPGTVLPGRPPNTGSLSARSYHETMMSPRGKNHSLGVTFTSTFSSSRSGVPYEPPALLFSGLGHRPRAFQDTLEHSWHAPGYKPPRHGWGGHALPPSRRPTLNCREVGQGLSLEASIGVSTSSRPFTSIERQGPMWRECARLESCAPSDMDPIHGTQRELVRSLAHTWKTSTSEQFKDYTFRGDR